MFEEKLQQAFANLQIPCTSDQAAQCARYFAMLVEANQTMNLTNVTQEDEAIPVSSTHLDVYKRQVGTQYLAPRYRRCSRHAVCPGVCNDLAAVGSQASA